MEARSLIFLELHNSFVGFSIPHHLTPIICSNLFFSTNMQDLLGFDITTSKREVNHIAQLNGIKHIYFPVYLTDIGARLSNIKKFHFHNYSPMFIVYFYD